MTDNEICVFCDIAKKQKKSYILIENENALAVLDAFPISDGHILIITKKHYDNLVSVDNHSAGDVFILIQKSILKLKKTLNIENFNIISNIGKMAYQSISHAHVHIIPKNKEEEGFIWTTKPIQTKYTLDDIFNKLIQ